MIVLNNNHIFNIGNIYSGIFEYNYNDDTLTEEINIYEDCLYICINYKNKSCIFDNCFSNRSFGAKTRNNQDIKLFKPYLLHDIYLILQKYYQNYGI